MKVTTPEFTVAFPYIFEKNTYDEDNPKFMFTMIFDEDADLSKINKAIKQVIKERWGSKPPKTLKMPLRDAKEKIDYNGFEKGMKFASASTKQRPGIVDRDREAILDEEDFYAGCRARATLNVFAYDNKSQGVAFGLNNIQKLADGERLDSRVAAEDDFEPLEKEEDVFK